MLKLGVERVSIGFWIRSNLSSSDQYGVLLGELILVPFPGISIFFIYKFNYPMVFDSFRIFVLTISGSLSPPIPSDFISSIWCSFRGTMEIYNPSIIIHPWRSIGSLSPITHPPPIHPPVSPTCALLKAKNSSGKAQLPRDQHISGEPEGPEGPKGPGPGPGPRADVGFGSWDGRFESGSHRRIYWEFIENWLTIDWELMALQFLVPLNRTYDTEIPSNIIKYHQISSNSHSSEPPSAHHGKPLLVERQRQLFW